MRTQHLFLAALLGAGTLLLPHQSLAQKRKKDQAPPPPVMQSITPNRNAQFVLLDGEVVQRLNKQITPLTQNIRLVPSGTKINVKSGIVEYVNGKITSLHEGDYVNAEGGLVFATPASAAAARGDSAVSANAKFDHYVQVGTAPTTVLTNAPTEREQLMMREIELLKNKITLLNQTHSNPPSTDAVDKQVQQIETQLKTMN
ncbi:MAG: DUF6799 domain-containing protein [Janthinobacterium lividum]